MSTTLHTALVQTHLAWENPIQNRAVLTEKIKTIPTTIDVIVLPEMCTTGFTMNAKAVAEPMDGPTMQWLTQLAKEKECAITGSISIHENDNYYNRLVFMKPDGSYETYDKQKLFSLANEQQVYTAGTTSICIAYKGWNIKPQICYDLRFPEQARNIETYDVLLYVASWPALRIEAWDSLLKARAIENMSYCIGVNRIGLDGLGYAHNGHSNVYNVLGQPLSEQPMERDTIIYATLEKEHISITRQKTPFLQDL